MFAVENISVPPDFDGNGEGLIAVIVRNSYHHPGVNFLTPPASNLQLAQMRRAAGETVPPHFHTRYERKLVGTAEVLLLRRGYLRLDLYASDRTLIASRELVSGDSVVLLGGGHALTFLEECELLEVKQGPYQQQTDKIPFTPKS